MIKQRGYGVLSFLLTALLLSIGGSYYYQTRMVQIESVRHTYESSAEEIRQMTSALLAYYKDNQSWPPNLNGIVTGGYFSGDPTRCGGDGVLQSSFCTTFIGSSNADKSSYTLTVNVLSDHLASIIANQLSQGLSAGSTVSTTIKVPYKSSIYEDYLQRFVDPDNPSRTQLEVDIDINENDLNNIGALSVATVKIKTLKVTDAKIKTLTLKTKVLKIGGNKITGTDSSLNFNSSLVNMNGQLAMWDHKVTDVDVLSAEEGTINKVIVTEGKFEAFRGKKLEYNAADISKSSGDDFQFDKGTIDRLTGDTLAVNTVTGSKTVKAKSGKFTNLSVQVLTVFQNEVDKIDIDSGIITNASGNMIISKDNAEIERLSSITVNSISTNGGRVSANTGSVSGNATLGNLSTTDLTVLNQLATKKISANISELGSASATSFSISGRVSVKGINVTTAEVKEAKTGDLTGSTAQFKTVNANHFKGGTFQSKEDFYTDVSSVNANYLRINEQKSKLDNCMYVTEYCLPQDPMVTVSCRRCVYSDFRTNFSGSVIANITQCRQGCSYSWVTKGTGLIFSGCDPGTILKGDSTSPSCRVSVKLQPQQIGTGTIEIVVVNSRYPSKEARASMLVEYLNSTTVDPFLNVATACVNAHRCHLDLTGLFSDDTVEWSVGDVFNGAGRGYSFMDPDDWHVLWSGDCTNAGNHCAFDVPHQDASYSATIAVKHLPTGRVKSYRVNFSITLSY